MDGSGSFLLGRFSKSLALQTRGTIQHNANTGSALPYLLSASVITCRQMPNKGAPRWGLKPGIMRRCRLTRAVPQGSHRRGLHIIGCRRTRCPPWLTNNRPLRVRQQRKTPQSFSTNMSLTRGGMRPAALVLLREWFSVICVSHSHRVITVICALILAPNFRWP